MNKALFCRVSGSSGCSFRILNAARAEAQLAGVIEVENIKGLEVVFAYVLARGNRIVQSTLTTVPSEYKIYSWQKNWSVQLEERAGASYSLAFL